MCGIVGYMGASEAASVLLSELRCLEYRGYDSAGVAIIENGELLVLKAAGKLSNLQELLESKKPGAKVGIGHTRWATHGIPNDENAHPHMDCTGTMALVHNGIIENHDVLRKELVAKGHKFSSQTDTEVASHLIEEEYKQEGDMLKAILKAVARIKGAYAMGIVSQVHPDTIYAVNQNYSLAVGVGDNECFLASDSVAVRQYTDSILRLEQNEIAEIKSNSVKLYSFDGNQVSRRPQVLDKNPFVLDKKGFRHFLLKEIHEQPTILRQTLSKYVVSADRPISLAPEHMSFAPGDDSDLNGSNYGVRLTDEQIRSIDRLCVVACGTAYYAGMVGKYIIEELCDLPVDVEIASEIRGRKMLVNDKTLTVAVSQSGETADTIAAVEEAKKKQAMLLGITNRPDSHLARITDNLIVTECGVEVSVAATKTFVAQVACFYLLGIYLAEKRGTLSAEKARQLKSELWRVPALQEKALAQEPIVKQKAIEHADAKDVVFVGRGISYPIALEGALKLKELSYIHASGYAAGELKHGPIAVLDAQVPVITIVVPGAVHEKTISNAQEAKARNAKMIAVCVEGDEEAKKVFDTILPIPPVSEFLSPLVSVIPLQLFAYYAADYLGKDVDQPRNLAKSVTVE